MLEARAESLSLDVLVGQLFIVHLSPEGRLGDVLHSHRTNHYGGYFLGSGNIRSIDAVRRLTHQFRAHPQEIPPAFVAADEEGGLVSAYGHVTTPAPSPRALGEIDDVDVTRDVHFGLGEKARALGLNTVFAPVVDVNSEPANPVIGTRAFGAAVELVTRHASAAQAGLRAAHVASCAKHFPGHGATTRDSHRTLPVVRDERQVLWERDLAPFRTLVEEDPAPDMVMIAHVSYPALDRKGIPATLSGDIVTGILRRELGYGGVVVSDAMEMEGVSAGRDPGTAAVEALKAGVDLLLYPLDVAMADAAYQAVLRAVQSRKISEEQIRISVDRIFRLRSRFQERSWMSPEEANETLDLSHEQAFYGAALDGLAVEGNAGVLGEIPRTEGARLIVLPTALDSHRSLDLDLVREQLGPAGFTVLEVGPTPSAEEIGRAVARAREAAVVIVGTVSRGPINDASRTLIDSLAAGDRIKVGVALLDPGDVDHMMGMNCRIKTFGFSRPQMWALCQKLLG